MGLLYPGYISSQESPYVFRQIGVVEGLPDNYVKAFSPFPTDVSVCEVLCY